MKKIWPLVATLVAVMSLVGCGGGASTRDDGIEGGAPVSEGGAGGGTATGADLPGAYQGDPLNDPASPLANRTIYFEFDSSDIRPEYRDVITAHAEYMAANPNVTVTIEGHCDERGSREYNIALGERRANAVRDLMRLMGPSDLQLQTISYGEERPVAFGHDEASWSQNRRVELVY